MIYKIIIKVPIFGNVLRIFNSYAYHGDAKADYEFAPTKLWLKAFWFPIFFSAFMMLLSSTNLHELIKSYAPCLARFPNVNKSVLPSDLILDILPNLLGFGIGVYALIFALSNTLVMGIQDLLNDSIDQGHRKNGSVLMLNSELAYPLIVLVLAIGYGVVAKLFTDCTHVTDFAWFVFWFSMITVIELVIALFSLGENELLLKIQSSKTSEEQPKQ